jgi:Tfp pilus assembly protein PilV
MSTIEPLTAAVIFLIALLSSLQIDVYIAQSSNGEASRQELGSAADAAMLASQALASNLSQPLTSPFPITDCNSAAITLAGEINKAPVPSDITRVATAQGILVLVQVEADKLTTRQRLLSPAAFGLCSSNS